LLPLPGFLSPFSFIPSLGSGGLIGVGSGMGLPSFWCSFTTYKDIILVYDNVCAKLLACFFCSPYLIT